MSAQSPPTEEVITLEAAQATAHALPLTRKLLYLSIFYAYRFDQAKLTCGGFDKPCSKQCTTISAPKINFLTLAKPALETVELRKCEVEEGLFTFFLMQAVPKVL